MLRKPKKQSVVERPKVGRPVGRFQIEKLEERIAPALAGCSGPNGKAKGWSKNHTDGCEK